MTKSHKSILVNFPCEKRVRIADHEILLSFSNDAGSEAFMEWWAIQGEQTMVEWCLENGYKAEVLDSDE